MPLPTNGVLHYGKIYVYLFIYLFIYLFMYLFIYLFITTPLNDVVDSPVYILSSDTEIMPNE
jgi:hypothetical protein